MRIRITPAILVVNSDLRKKLSVQIWDTTLCGEVCLLGKFHTLN